MASTFNRQLFEEALTAHNMTARAFADIADVSEAHVSLVRSGKANPCFSFLSALTRAFPNWAIDRFFEEQANA